MYTRTGFIMSGQVLAMISWIREAAAPRICRWRAVTVWLPLSLTHGIP
jgi:hypothetical protein